MGGGGGGSASSARQRSLMFFASLPCHRAQCTGARAGPGVPLAAVVEVHNLVGGPTAALHGIAALIHLAAPQAEPRCCSPACQARDLVRTSQRMSSTGWSMVLSSLIIGVHMFLGRDWTWHCHILTCPCARLAPSRIALKLRMRCGKARGSRFTSSNSLHSAEKHQLALVPDECCAGAAPRGCRQLSVCRHRISACAVFKGIVTGKREGC